MIGFISLILIGMISADAFQMKMIINPYTTAPFAVPRSSGPPVVPPSPPFIEYSKFNPNWYVVGEANNIQIDKPYKVTLLNSPIAVWKSKHNEYGAIGDVCPHRGASLSCGRVDKSLNAVVCPYHTFKYNKYGQLIQIPGQNSVRTGTSFNFKTDVPHYAVVEKDGWVHILNKPSYDLNELRFLNDPDTIWSEPESLDPKFKCVYLSKKFNQDSRTVTENSLDILHISEVHTFGNKQRPLPLKDKLEKISDGHWKASYTYEAGTDSYASKLFNIKTLEVENEYILPHTTVARVKFGDFTNTIITSASPISSSETMLYVKAYRNNWVFGFEPLDLLFDKLTQNMMEKTLREDKGVIDTIYPEFRDGNFITKYDELVRKYREDYAAMVENSFLK